MAAPIVITVGRQGEVKDLRFKLTPIEPIDRVWGAYIVEISYPNPQGSMTTHRLGLSDFPRAAGTDHLALLLLQFWCTKSTAAGGIDPSFPGQDYPPMPSDEELAKRPPTFYPVDVAAMAEVLEAGPAHEATAL